MEVHLQLGKYIFGANWYSRFQHYEEWLDKSKMGRLINNKEQRLIMYTRKHARATPKQKLISKAAISVKRTPERWRMATIIFFVVKPH